MHSCARGLTRKEFLQLSAAGLGAAALLRSDPALGDPMDAIVAGGLADTILVGGKILTMDTADSTVQALAIRGGVIIATGSDSAIRALAGSETVVVDCSGRTVTPGLVDTHLHFQFVGMMGSYYIPFVPPEIKSLSDLKEKLSDLLRTLPRGEWVNGYHLLQTQPTRADLDPVSPDHPVWIFNQPGHIGSANSKALEIAKITAATPDPTGGIIERDSSGSPTGVFYNHRAMDLVRRYMPTIPIAGQWDSIRSTQRTFAALGVTSYHDNNVRGAENVRSYIELAKRNELWLRGAISFTLEYPSDVPIALSLPAYSSQYMRFAGYKFLIDGQAPTSYCHEPTTGISWNMPTWEISSFKNAVRQLHATGLQICVHCVGDAAFDLALDAYEEALNANPRSDARHRIEHAILTKPASTRRAKDLGVALSVQPAFLRFAGDYYESLYGAERVPRILVTREWLEAGIPVAISSDAPTIPWIAPGVTLANALARTTATNRVLGPDQVLTIREALRAHTATAAYAIHQEKTMGSIEPGKVADVIIWTKDPLTATPAQLFSATIDLALVGGKVIFPLGPAGSWLLPSSAHAKGKDPTFWTTDLTVANTGTTDAGLTVKFLGNNKDGTDGPEKSYALGAGKSVTYPDILKSEFGLDSAWGAILVTADTPSLAVVSQTTTPASPKGTYGQSVPGAGPSDLIVYGLPKSILAVRQDGTFRTNLIIANANATPVDVDVAFVLKDGTTYEAKTYALLPLGMTQVGDVPRAFTQADVIDGRLVLSTPTQNGTFAAYAVVIDGDTGDPRTLLPR